MSEEMRNRLSGGSPRSRFEPALGPVRDRLRLTFDPRVPPRQEAVHHPEYPLERICSHRYQPFQLTFARHAMQLIAQRDDIELEATHRGLILRAETEAALDGAIRTLQEHYGSQLRAGATTVRYHSGASLEEPHMVVRVSCQPKYLEAVRADLLARHARILEAEATPTRVIVRATAPLLGLIGYGWSLARLTSGTARETMRLSHYAPAESPPPDGDAA